MKHYFIINPAAGKKDSRQRAKSAPGRAAQRGSRPSDFEGLDSLLDKI